MKQSNNYIADHLSVLMVRMDNGIDCKEELDLYRKEVEKQRIDVSFIAELYRINKVMWPIHDIIVNPETDDKTVASMTRKLLELNVERVKVRNEIAKLFGEFTEVKTYAS